MTFQEMLTEFYARGFDYLNDSGAGEVRAKRWINQSYQEICGLDDWPFLEASTSGACPLTISDLRTVMSVTDTTTKQPIGFVDRRTIYEAYPTADSMTGSGLFAYLTGGNTINVFPGNTDAVSVRYIRVPTDLSASTDTPLIPARYRYAIVDFACGRAYMDSDNPEMAQAVRADGDTLVGSMREHLLYGQHQDPDSVVAYGFSSDWRNFR